jgi:NADP-dependent aldehyde dehydrogenase
MELHKILIGGDWRAADACGTFQAEDPGAQRVLADVYPVSSWRDCEAALAAATQAATVLAHIDAERIAAFLEDYALRIEQQKTELVDMAHAETALPKTPRLADVELPRTTNQLRVAAAAAREGSWALPTIDTKLNIRSCHAAIGPACVFGPNNFPFAFNSIAGGDFAAALAAGNPVIAKANTSHPGVTRLLAVEAYRAARAAGLPAGAIQLLYRLRHDDGERLVADDRVGATAYTGSRAAGLALKAAADRAGKPIYLELSSVNPVIILAGALAERLPQIADDFTGSCLMGTGQFCTNPGLVVLVRGPRTDEFLAALVERFQKAAVGTLLSRGVQQSLAQGVATWRAAGAQLLTGDEDGSGRGYSRANTLLRASGAAFLKNPVALQTEAFGNASLLVVADDLAQVVAVIDHLEGNLTGSIYTSSSGSDDADYALVAQRLRPRVGRLLNDKMPTGVAVSAAMNHGGPYPATGHPGFTAVGIPAALRRFSALQCYDNVRHTRLPGCLQDRNPNGKMWRLIDGHWTQGDVAAPSR